jgi:hypothetical protein
MHWRLVSTSLVLSTTVIVTAQSTKMIDRIIDEGRDQTQVASLLWHLTKKVGPRTTGTPQLDQAQAWVMNKLIEWGCENVKLEKWGEFPVGFRRGPRQSAKIFIFPPAPAPSYRWWPSIPSDSDFKSTQGAPRWIPWEKSIDFSTPNWTPGTPGPVRGPAIIAPQSIAEFEAVKLRLKGAWIIEPGETGMRGGKPGNTEIDTMLDKAGIAGRVYNSGSNLVWTHGQQAVNPKDLPKRVVVNIGRPDYKIITQHLKTGSNVQLEIDAENVFLDGPFPVYNVMGDIRGTEKPDEYVILSAHLDSWNGPGSEGANDNGTGSMVMLEAMRILKASGVRPKRTIRLVLWGGEEEGLLGSAAYVKQHANELPKISAAFNDDGGSNYEGGLSILKAWMPTFAPLEEAINRAFPGMPFKLNVIDALPKGGGGSDHASFNAVGVPGLSWYETGRQSYRYVWHTQYDTYENAIPEYLVQSATNSALAAYLLGMSDDLLPRQPSANPVR